VVIWYIFPVLVRLDREKSGIPVAGLIFRTRICTVVEMADTLRNTLAGVSTQVLKKYIENEKRRKNILRLTMRSTRFYNFCLRSKLFSPEFETSNMLIVDKCKCTFFHTL
jgi:hypothetical protein